MIVILAGVLGFLVGLWMTHDYIVAPLRETEAKLRKELGQVRADLYRAKHPTYDEARDIILRRAHSDVLHIPNPEDLLR